MNAADIVPLNVAGSEDRLARREKEKQFPYGYYDDGELWDADEDCKHYVISGAHGGIRCIHCHGWFCY